MVIYTDLLTTLFYINNLISTLFLMLLTIVDNLKYNIIVDKFIC